MPITRCYICQHPVPEVPEDSIDEHEIQCPEHGVYTVSATAQKLLKTGYQLKDDIETILEERRKTTSTPKITSYDTAPSSSAD